MKKAIVGMSRTGYWEVTCDDTGRSLGFYSTELDAYKAANAAGYLVR